MLAAATKRKSFPSNKQEKICIPIGSSY